MSPAITQQNIMRREEGYELGDAIYERIEMNQDEQMEGYAMPDAVGGQIERDMMPHFKAERPIVKNMKQHITPKKNPKISQVGYESPKSEQQVVELPHAPSVSE